MGQGPGTRVYVEAIYAGLVDPDKGKKLREYVLENNHDNGVLFEPEGIPDASA